MLEGAFYGLDLLKLHSVTTKLVGRMDKLEEEVSKNLTKENEQIKEDMEEIRTEMSKRGKENCSESILDGMPDVRAALQRDAAAAYAPPEVRPWLPGSQGHSPQGAPCQACTRAPSSAPSGSFTAVVSSSRRQGRG